MTRELARSFFDRPAKTVARDLVGCFLVTKGRNGHKRHMITETEAYDGPGDLASHASKGRTKRTELMFGPPGFYYVYLVYGLHWMLNVTTGPVDYPAAVLIRGIMGYHGPAKLTKKLRVSGKLNGMEATRRSGIWFEKRNPAFDPIKIKADKRIGIDYAGPIWSKKKWRFTLISSSS